MKNNLNSIKDLVFKAVQSAGFEMSPGKIQLDQTKTLEYGHFASNAALVLAKQAGKNPREVAQKIVEELQKEPLFEKVEIAGPGFINLFIEQKFYTEFCQLLNKNFDQYIREELRLSASPKMVIEYSSPNIAKPLGVHHLLSTIIGDSLSKIYMRLGYQVISENYPGDIGTQFGKLICAIKKWGDFDQIAKDPIDELLKLYVKFHDEAEKDSSLEDEGREEYKKFEEGDQESRKMWQQIVDWSMQEIQPLYDRLNIKFDGVHGESFFENKMQSIIEKGISKGIFKDGEKGALIMETDDPNEPPALVKKSDGTTLYLTRDLAQIEFFEHAYQPDLMVWAVDVAQSLHFRHRFEAAKKLELTQAELRHVEFGRMQFKDGSMSTRKGNIVHLKQVLDESEKRSLELIKEKEADLSPSEQEELSRIMGVGSVKYNILHQNRIQNMTFEWDKMLSFEGNSAPYLMYTVARAKSVLRKAGITENQIGDYKLNMVDDTEQELVLNLTGYADTLKRAKEEFKPNHIANYLYSLAQSFNSFYNAQSILQAEENLKNSRLLLVASTIKVMEDGFSLLGIEVPEKM